MLVSRLALSVHGFLCVHEQFHFLMSNGRIRSTNFPGNQKFLCNFWLQTSLRRAYCWLGNLTDTLSMSTYPVCCMYCVLHSYNTGSIRKITRKRTYTVMSCNICVGADLCSSDLHCSRSPEPRELPTCTRGRKRFIAALSAVVKYQNPSVSIKASMWVNSNISTLWIKP